MTVFMSNKIQMKIGDKRRLSSSDAHRYAVWMRDVFGGLCMHSELDFVDAEFEYEGRLMGIVRTTKSSQNGIFAAGVEEGGGTTGVPVAIFLTQFDSFEELV